MEYYHFPKSSKTLIRPTNHSCHQGQYFSIIICLFLKIADAAPRKRPCFLKSGYFDGNMSGIFIVCFPSMIPRTTYFVETQCIQWGGDSIPQFPLDHQGMTLGGSVPNGWPSQTRRDFDKPTDFYPSHLSEIFHQWCLLIEVSAVSSAVRTQLASVCGTRKQNISIL